MSNKFLSAQKLVSRVERKSKSRKASSSIHNSTNNSKRPLISIDIITQINRLLDIKDTDFTKSDLGRKLTYAEVKILASLLISATKLGIVRKITKKKQMLVILNL